MKLLAAIAVAAGALVLTAASSSAGAARHAAHSPLGFVPHAAHASPVATARRTVKPAALNCIATCSNYETTINQYFTDVAAAATANATDNVYSVATQYSGITYGSTFGGSYVATSPYPTNTCHDGVDKFCLTDGQLQAEIGKVIAAKGWPLDTQTAMYFIFTPANVGVCLFNGQPSNTNACTTNAFCAYHSDAGSFIYAAEPDAAAVAGGFCSAGEAPEGNGADATINTISHEQNEAITDPYGNAWTSNDTFGPEIGDLCAYDFGTPLGNPGTEYNQVINSHNYYLQLEYSNQDSGCVPYLGGTVSPANPQDGIGPLVNHNGPVMTTNAAYAIYWVPTAPADRSLPTISGTPKVGKKLTAAHGTWTSLPKFTYRWLRCTSAGTACKGIANATASSYLLVAADKGHRLEVRVTATNAIGSASAVSAPTAAVHAARRK